MSPHRFLYPFLLVFPILLYYQGILAIFNCKTDNIRYSLSRCNRSEVHVAVCWPSPWLPMGVLHTWYSWWGVLAILVILLPWFIVIIFLACSTQWPLLCPTGVKLVFCRFSLCKNHHLSVWWLPPFLQVHQPQHFTFWEHVAVLHFRTVPIALEPCDKRCRYLVS